MRLIHNISFTEAEVEMYRRIVFHNMVDGMRQILQAIDDASASLQHPEYVVSITVTTPHRLDMGRNR